MNARRRRAGDKPPFAGAVLVLRPLREVVASELSDTSRANHTRPSTGPRSPFPGSFRPWRSTTAVRCGRSPRRSLARLEQLPFSVVLAFQTGDRPQNRCCFASSAARGRQTRPTYRESCGPDAPKLPRSGIRQRLHLDRRVRAVAGPRESLCTCAPCLSSGKRFLLLKKFQRVNGGPIL